MERCGEWEEEGGMGEDEGEERSDQEGVKKVRNRLIGRFVETEFKKAKQKMKSYNLKSEVAIHNTKKIVIFICHFQKLNIKLWVFHFIFWSSSPEFLKGERKKGFAIVQS